MLAVSLFTRLSHFSSNIPSPIVMSRTLLRVPMTTSRILHNNTDEAALTPRLPPLITVKTHPSCSPLSATCISVTNGIYPENPITKNHFFFGVGLNDVLLLLAFLVFLNFSNLLVLIGVFCIFLSIYFSPFIFIY